MPEIFIDYLLIFVIGYSIGRGVGHYFQLQNERKLEMMLMNALPGLSAEDSSRETATEHAATNKPLFYSSKVSGTFRFRDASAQRDRT